jgi:dipeptidyl aminopeptidase/acylaminoacyl peptidase
MRSNYTSSKLLLIISLALLLPAERVSADELTYQMPAKAIADLVEVPPTPSARLSPDRKKMLLMEQRSLPSIVEISQPELRLAGLRINPKTNGASRPWASFAKLYLEDVGVDKATPKQITGFPEGARIENVLWSPDGTKLGCTVTDNSGITLWLVDAATGKASKLINDYINSCFYHGAPFRWEAGGTIIAKLVPKNRGTEPANDPVPHGPIVQENDGKKRPTRTDPNLLKSPRDEQLFDYFMRSQIARVQLDGRVEHIGAPGIYKSIEPSPDGKHVLVETIHRPYSYKVGYERFPYRVEVLSSSSHSVEKKLADNPLAEEVPIDFSAVPTGPRDFGWRQDADATAVWVEARDDGDPKVKADIRDEVLTLPAPFDGTPKSLVKLPLRYADIYWGNGFALVQENWWDDRKTRTYMLAPDDPASKPRVVWDRSFQDRYSDPGTPLFYMTSRGAMLIRQAGDGSILLRGEGACPEGDRPFVDKLDPKTLASKRIWRSEPPNYEVARDVFDNNGENLLITRESVTEPAQYYKVALADSTWKRLTDFPNPNPSLKDVSKKLIQYQRADGVKLSGMLYLPPGFKAGESKPVPVLMWAYPTEFKSKDTAGQVQDSPYRFVRAHYMGPLFALLMGFAVLDDPTFPIVGEGKEEPNDTYVSQLVAGAEAAVNEVVKMGVADRDRIAIGGHSYGAFTTANLLAHSNLFRTGIARSGAYNRTLTPFGFQSEERDFWKAKSTYIDMSPFTFADKIDEPLLLIHGEADDNTGTYTIQSERLFEAMKGLGGKVRLVILPAEAHGYRARESVLHTLWEMSRWLDKNVREAPPVKRPS